MPSFINCQPDQQIITKKDKHEKEYNYCITCIDMHHNHRLQKMERQCMRQIMMKFQERNGTTQCKQLKGVGTGAVLSDASFTSLRASHGSAYSAVQVRILRTVQGGMKESRER